MRKRCTLSMSLMIVVVVLVSAFAAQASVFSHGLGELDKLVRGEAWTANYPGMIVQATEYLPPGTSPPALSVRPHPQEAYFLKGVVVRFDITFLTGDYEGRPGQVMFSGPISGITVDEYHKEDAHDSGGMGLVTTFRKETKRISFTWDTSVKDSDESEGNSIYPEGAYTFLVEQFSRSKRQQYSEIAIPVFLAASFGEVKEALKDADDTTLARYGLKRLSQVLEARRSPNWTGDIYFSDGSYLEKASTPGTPQVGMAFALLSGSKVLGGGMIESVNGSSIRTSASSSIMHGYKDRLGELKVKFAYRTEVEEVVHFKGEVNVGIPDEVSGSANHPVKGRKYMTLGRNPMVPGGIKRSDLKAGQEIVDLPFDAYVQGMRGASGERVSGWLRAGTPIVARKVRTTDANGGTVYAWKVEAAQPCGNIHPFYFSPAASPTPQPVKIKLNYWIPMDLPVQAAQEISVIGWALNGAPVLSAKDIERLQASRPGLISVGMSLTPARNILHNGSESNSAAAAASSSTSESDSTAINNNDNNIVIDVDQQQQQEQQ